MFLICQIRDIYVLCLYSFLGLKMCQRRVSGKNTPIWPLIHCLYRIFASIMVIYYMFVCLCIGRKELKRGQSVRMRTKLDSNAVKRGMGCCERLLTLCMRTYMNVRCLCVACILAWGLVPRIDEMAVEKCVFANSFRVVYKNENSANFTNCFFNSLALDESYQKVKLINQNVFNMSYDQICIGLVLIMWFKNR